MGVQAGLGKAQKAYAALSPAEARDYDQLNRPILRRYDITDESYRQRFRSGRRGKEESNRELVARLNNLAGKWLKEKLIKGHVNKLLTRLFWSSS